MVVTWTAPKINPCAYLGVGFDAKVNKMCRTVELTQLPPEIIEQIIDNLPLSDVLKTDPVLQILTQSDK